MSIARRLTVLVAAAALAAGAALPASAADPVRSAVRKDAKNDLSAWSADVRRQYAGIDIAKVAYSWDGERLTVRVKSRSLTKRNFKPYARHTDFTVWAEDAEGNIWYFASYKGEGILVGEGYDNELVEGYCSAGAEKAVRDRDLFKMTVPASCLSSYWLPNGPARLKVSADYRILGGYHDGGDGSVYQDVIAGDGTRYGPFIDLQ